MKNLKTKNIMGIMVFIWLSVLLTGCSSTDPTEKNTNTGGGGLPSDEKFITLDEAKQAEYKAQWLENVSGITKIDYYVGNGFPFYANGDTIFADLAFVKGNLLHTSSYYRCYILLSDADNSTANKTTFINGNTAIMYVHRSASPDVDRALYIVRVADNKIYRTKNVWGFGGSEENTINLDNWDGKTIPKSVLDDLIVIAEPKI